MQEHENGYLSETLDSEFEQYWEKLCNKNTEKSKLMSEKMNKITQCKGKTSKDIKNAKTPAKTGFSSTVDGLLSLANEKKCSEKSKVEEIRKNSVTNVSNLMNNAILTLSDSSDADIRKKSMHKANESEKEMSESEKDRRESKKKLHKSDKVIKQKQSMEIMQKRKDICTNLKLTHSFMVIKDAIEPYDHLKAGFEAFKMHFDNNKTNVENIIEALKEEAYLFTFVNCVLQRVKLNNDKEAIKHCLYLLSVIEQNV